MTNTIHRFKQGEDYIIVDVNSGGVHIVDELVYEMVGCLEPPLAEEMPESLIGELKKFPE